MQLKTGNIQKFLETIPNDRLAALQAHCEDGKLSYTSCSCLIGSVTAPHSLGVAGEYCESTLGHVNEARAIPFANEAEREFLYLGNPGDGISPWNDELRRERLKPLILAEQERRAQSSTNILDSREAVEVGL